MVASTIAGISGRPRGVITPSCIFEVIRDEKMPPSAPACETNGGITAISAGTAASWPSRACCSCPASTSRIGVSRIVAVISQTILRSSRSFVR